MSLNVVTLHRVFISVNRCVEGPLSFCLSLSLVNRYPQRSSLRFIRQVPPGETPFLLQ